MISRTFPPFTVGSAILMSNFFRSYKGNLNAIACWQYEAKQDPAFEPPCETVYLKMPFALLQRVYDKFQYRLIGLTRYFIKRRIKNLRPSCVFLVFPNAPFLIAAYQICKELNISYLIQMHDLWEENYAANHPVGALARKWEKRIFEDAERRFSMTSIQQKHYIEKYKLEVEVLPHTIVPARIEELKTRIANTLTEEKGITTSPTVVYTGNISHKMNLDALQQFVAAVDLLPAHYEVKMFVSFTVDQCKELKLYNPRIKYDWLPMEGVQAQMRSAAVLFLPLSFKNAAMDEVKTVYATKTLDYLVSGVPMLVYSPSDSFHTVSAKEGGWGYVVEEDAPEAIAKGIQELVENKALAQKIVGEAINEAKRRSASKYALQLEEIVNHI